MKSANAGERRELVDIALFIAILAGYRIATDTKTRRILIQKIFSTIDWYVLYFDKTTGRRVLAETSRIQHDHEGRTAMRLTKMNYDVLFAPAGLFKRSQKKFDVFLVRDTFLLEADMKSIVSKNPETIANRIIEGSNQASRVILEIRSDISGKELVDGLRSGTGKNKLIKEVLMFYRNKFYVFPVNLIWSKKIFEIIKNEKGFQ